jgi:cytochrome c biogenesis protein CcdA
MYKYITLLEICQVHWGGVEDDGLVLTAVQEMHELEEGRLSAAASGIGQLLYAYRLALMKVGGVSSALMGFFFGAGWPPCVGPVLGAILTLALSEATVEHGALLLFGYSMGLGVLRSGRRSTTPLE